MRLENSRSPVWRSAWLVLAVVALLARVASPPGTMLARTAHGVQRVLCTGHGPMAMAMSSATTMSDPANSSHPAKAHSDGSCEFAAQAAHALNTQPLELVGSSAWTPAPTAQPIVLRTTGSGLAAPPPPSHAPPHNLV